MQYFVQILNVECMNVYLPNTRHEIENEKKTH